MKFSLKKLLDVSILPTVVAVTSKFLGVLLAVRLFNLQFITEIHGFFPGIVVEYTSRDLEILSNSVSQLFTGLALGLGCGFFLLQAYHFHETHIPPKRAARLLRSGFAHVITNSRDVFHRLFIWISLLWFITFWSLYETYIGLVSVWVSVLLLVVAYAYTHFLTRDVEKEHVTD